jgi:hypothetical protein
MYNGDQSVLLKNPDLVASTWLNLASATFFFVYPQPPKPSMLHVLDGTWVPNAADNAAGAGNNFATTIMIINAECGTGTEKAAQNRIDYYKQFAADLGWNVGGTAVVRQHAAFQLKQFGGLQHLLGEELEHWRRLPVPARELPDAVQRPHRRQLHQVR